MVTSYSRNDLKEQLTGLSQCINKINKRKFEGDTFGPDKLSASDIIEVTKDLIVSLKSLSASRHTFSMLVDHSELQLINRKLRVIIDNYEKENLVKVYDHLSELINALRGMNLKVGWSLEHGARSAAIELNDRVEKTQSKVDALERLDREYHNKLQRIRTLKDKVESETKSISAFYTELNKRMAEFEQQKQFTKEYEEHLIDFQAQHEDTMKEAKRLIDEAEKALEVKTAEGLSQAFNTKSEKAGRWRSNVPWVILGVGFMAGAAVIGYQLFDAKELGMEHIVARLSLIPVLLAGAWFSASRYIYQRNLTEDYDYKKVLMSSHVAFAKNLRENGDDTGEHYRDYIKGFLREIYQHPIKASPNSQNDDKSDNSNNDNEKMKQQFNSLEQRYDKLSRELELRTNQLERLESLVNS
ncbi:MULTISPECIES: hypothetical protein [Idiomarina]|jgi:DNA repair ATPase RecN|uniref:hypothetical protein n=1 Tax=Idiomarina TaxID=135575 RepID=UPI000C0968E3|nr:MULTISPECIES: hypothetical protein [Idiomarina]MAC35599.1 hypothetical protein [Haliea sp.]MAO67910.1 hypothetical protein [Idiomarina sp.]MBF79652.1 hypothetical protein [Idiomarina sp.]|tara:strand:+ start:9863 stop:11101 length:1239 start_codon:yes stop_codon:yes gene_type:complete